MNFIVVDISLEYTGGYLKGGFEKVSDAASALNIWKKNDVDDHHTIQEQDSRTF